MNKWLKKDLKYIWHPYTQMKDAKEFPPILIEKARGVKLYDAKGRFYYDTISSWWCNVHGHNHPGIKRAIKKQLDSLDHVLFAGITHKPAIQLAENLIKITPGALKKVFFSDNGSTAVETALKMSFQYWHNTGKRKKKMFVALDYGYHGDTIGAMSVSEVSLFNEMFSPLFFKTLNVPSPYCYRCPVGKERSSCDIDCIKPLEALISKKGDEIAALILEPLVMAAGGMIIYPKEYLKKAREVTEKYDVHLIVDEVATGFGRTGRMFASEYAKIEPDFMCLSKGITSGYLPLGATLTTDKVYDAFYAEYKMKKTFYHGHTFTANPISVSAALASLAAFKKEKTLEEVRGKMPLFHKHMETFRALPLAGDVRYLGMIGAIELVKDKASKEPFGIEERIGMRIYEEGLKKKLLLRPLGNIVYFFLPLVIKKNEIKYVLETTREIIGKIPM